MDVKTCASDFVQMTSGGTESIVMACKAYRNYGRAERGVTKPNMVMCVSVTHDLSQFYYFYKSL